jgi:hypothetical protein
VFSEGFVGVLEPGYTMYVDGSRNYEGADDMPLTARAGVWKDVMERSFDDGPGHDGMVRFINPNARPSWSTPEQVAMNYQTYTGKPMDPVERSKQQMAVKPNDHFLSVNRYPASHRKELIAGTIMAGVVVTLPMTAPVAVRALRAAPVIAGEVKTLRIAADAVVGPQVRIAFEERAEELLLDLGEEVKQKSLKMIFDP